MNRKILSMTLTTVAILATVASASAQTTKPMGLSARIGGFFPSNGDARDENNTWLAAGLEYKIKDMNLGTSDTGMMSSLTISVDWYGSGDFRNVPVLLNWVGHHNEWFYSVGAGASFGRFPTTAAPGGEDRTRVGYQLGVGYEFQRSTTPLFLEAKYFGTSESELNGFGVYVGVRF